MKQITTDVVVVGGGAAGLLAALVARRNGLEVILVESTPQIGGGTATDTGFVWLPGNHLATRGGGGDTPEDSLEYLEAILGPVTDASTADRRSALARTGGPLSRWLEANRIQLTAAKLQPDFHPGAPKSRKNGRVLTSAPYDQRELGAWAGQVRTSRYGLELAPRSPRGLVAAAATLTRRAFNPTKDIVTGGTGLVAQLLHQAIQGGVLVWLDSPVTDLASEHGRVSGVIVEREGAPLELRANNGVILAAGGFEANQSLREEHLPLPTDAAWSTGYEGNLGVPMLAATSVGGQLTAMNEAWWTFVALFEGTPYRMTLERSMPFGIIVDSAGDRFVNEASAMPEGAFEAYVRHRRVHAIPGLLLVENRHRQYYKMGPWLPGSVPRRDEPAIIRATSLDEMAATTEIDRAGLLGSVVRFNGMASKGRDDDFGRGSSPHDRAHGDPTRPKNPNLGPLEKSPYWAVPVFPGDTGTKGGLIVDDAGRVLDASAAPIPGLWAVSGTAASLFKGTAPGNGAGLGAALVDAFRAALDVAGELGRVDGP